MEEIKTLDLWESTCTTGVNCKLRTYYYAFKPQPVYIVNCARPLKALFFMAYYCCSVGCGLCRALATEQSLDSWHLYTPFILPDVCLGSAGVW